MLIPASVRTVDYRHLFGRIECRADPTKSHKDRQRYSNVSFLVRNTLSAPPSAKTVFIYHTYIIKRCTINVIIEFTVYFYFKSR